MMRGLGVAEHCSVDNFDVSVDYLAEWAADALGTRAASLKGITQ